MSTQSQPIESHAAHRDRLLEHAREMIEAGDRLQASEKVWGAVVHALKVVADERGWPFHSHVDGLIIASWIAEQSARPDISNLYGAVSDLHQNFYVDEHPLDVIRDRLLGAERFLGLLREAHRTMPPDLQMPTNAGYRNRAARYGQGESLSEQTL